MFNPQYMKGSDGWLLHALNSKPPLCECLGIMPSDEPPPAWSPSSLPGVGWGGVCHEEK